MSFDRAHIPKLYPAPTQLEVVPGFAVDHQVTLLIKESLVSTLPPFLCSSFPATRTYLGRAIEHG